MKGAISTQEIQFTRDALGWSLKAGAQKARAILDKSTMDLVNTLNGEIDKVTHCMDRCLTLHLFVDGRYGCYSTNKLSRDDVKAFIAKSVDATRMLAEDPCRDLPDPELTEKAAITGREMDIVDEEAYEAMTPKDRISLALSASIYGKVDEDGFRYVSEEAEYSDTVEDSLVLDSQGLECRMTETSFDYAVEVTVEDPDGEKYTGYWWDGRPRLAELELESYCPKALRRALASMDAGEVESGRYNMVIDTEAASKAVSAILRALGGYALQQHDSFLEGSLGKQIFPEGMTIVDCARQKGFPGAKLFDSEGVSTQEGPIIENGIIRKYFINTFISRKMGLPQTGEDAVRPRVMPYLSEKLGRMPSDGHLDREKIMELCGEGILVTEFNGGNSNSSSGDFSYGISGFYFREGKVVCPVEEMLVTGNFITLWNSLLAAGDDYRTCMSKLIPTLAFSNVDFSA